MSTVYLAMSGHHELETVCVVKRLLPALAAEPEHLRRFRHEADLARRLSHSNLVNTHNIGEVDGEVFLVQEFVEGQDVSELLAELGKRRRSLPIPIAVYIASEIARGLSYAHTFEDLQLVHRDINQPNVRLTYAGEVKLLDFGIASSNLHGERAADGGARGKLWHLAPEQIRPGATVDRRTDVYAVGVLLWELLTGRPVGTTRAGTQEGRTPETEGEVMVWITRGQHQAPSAFNMDVPFELDALVAKAMHVDPELRFASADELRRALSSFLASDLHPEEDLCALMKEFFSPERERSERQRLIESGRDLLVSEGGPSRDLPPATIVVVSTTARRAVSFVRRNAAWMAPVALGALIGTASLFYLHHSRASVAVDSRTFSGTATDENATGTSAPIVVAPEKLPAPSTAASQTAPSAPSAKSPAKSEENPRPPATASSHATTPAALAPQPSSPQAPAPKLEVPAPKVDHLELARQAFNDRDWTRALTEAKAATTIGGGADAHALIGNIYFKMGQYSDAEKAYERAVALDAQNPLLQERLRIARARAEQSRTGQ
jgi:serine/threonine protein kinase